MLRALREHGALSRGEIAQRVDLSRTTLSEITNDLLARGAIVVISTDADRREGSGRPAERLALDPSSGQFMGVDIGHTRVHVAVADASHEVIAAGVTRYDLDPAWPDRIARAFALIEQLSEETGVHYGALQGVAVGLAGPFPDLLRAHNSEAGRTSTVDLVSEAFAERFGAPVIIDNNSRLAALAEAIGSSDGSVQDLVYVRLSDGIGGGLVVGGRLVLGSSGFAGELGHVAVADSSASTGVECRCGKRGCLETVASVPSILAECRARGVTMENLDDLRIAVAKGDPIVDAVLRTAATALGKVLGAAAVTLNPSEIVLAGEITQIAPVILQQVTATVGYELIAIDASPRIRVAQLSDDDGALGAIAALFHQSPLLASYQELANRPVSSPLMQRSIS